MIEHASMEGGALSAPPLVSAVIPTKNRQESLRQVVRSVIQQTIPCEVICIDDASTDGTVRMLEREFPSVRILKNQVSRGPAAARNAGAYAASGKYLLTLDDDCVLSNPKGIETALDLFDSNELAAVTLPFVNVQIDATVRTVAPEPTGTFVTTDYYAGMVLFRRDLFLDVNGYREEYFMHHEEPDLAIRLLEKRRFVRNGSNRLIDHYESPVRDSKKLWRLGARNAILFAVYNVPFVLLPLHLASTVTRTFLYALKRGGAVPVLKGFCDSLPIVSRTTRLRAPVSIKTYRAFRILKNRGPLRLKVMKEVLKDG
jgi:glycosyltransferase involved in cell wall biosynthesis